MMQLLNHLRKSLGRAALFASMLGLSAFATGCGDLDTVEHTERRVVQLPAPSGSVANSGASFPAIPLYFEHRTALPKKKDLDPDNIDSVKLGSIRVSILNPRPNDNLGFVKDIQVYLRTNDDDQSLVAFGGPYVLSEKTVELRLTDSELKPYIIADQAEIFAIFAGFEPGAQLDLEVEARFLIDINIPNIIF